ncbi:hypothetical protein ACQRWP_06740 [Micromonospora trifolii]|uniref:hypothetical protein n=1 Tax=Micromonospora trifolii TaxID=2911208 RepID=UPI003D2EA61D
MAAMLVHKGIMLATGNETRPLNSWLYRLLGVFSLILLLSLSFAIGADAACLLFVLIIGGGLVAFIARRNNKAAPATGQYGPQQPPHLPVIRDSVASFVRGLQQYDQTKDLAVLDRAIAEGRALVRAEQDVEAWRNFAIMLGQALMSRNLATNDQGALAESVEVLRSVGQNLPPGHRMRPHALVKLGTALRELANQSGRLELVDEAIHWYSLCSAVKSPKQAQAYLGLSMCLNIKGEKLADAGLLEQAVAPARYAVGSTRDPQQRGKYLLYLSGLLVLLHRRTEDPAVIREAVTAAEEAVRLSPDQQERYAREKVLTVAQAQQQFGGWFE